MTLRADCLRYGPFNATPRSIGCSSSVLQCQPLSSCLRNANDFSIRSRCEISRLSRLRGVGLACPDPTSQHVPVQVEAIGLHVDAAMAVLKFWIKADRSKSGTQRVVVEDWLPDYPGQTAEEKTRAFAKKRSAAAVQW